MTTRVLTLRHAPHLRIDARTLQPAALAALSPPEIETLQLFLGREPIALAELFDVRLGDDADEATLILDGDLSRFDAVGAGLAGGRLEVHGPVGDSAGLGMSDGVLHIRGSARDLAGCSLRGGWLEVDGDIGDFGAGALPGDLDGMRGGTLCVHGRAGARLGDRMRRGTVVVHGDCGDFAASRMVAGTLALGGRCGAHPAWGMRRGSLLFAGAVPALPPSFVPVAAEAVVFWQLLARELAHFGGPFAGLPQRAVERHAGDLAVQGHGELLILR